MADTNDGEALERLRAQIAEFHPDYPPAVVEVIADALVSTKQVRTYCQHCRKSIYVRIPDASASMAGVKELMDRSRGRPGVAEGGSGPAVVVRRVFPREVGAPEGEAA